MFPSQSQNKRREKFEFLPGLVHSLIRWSPGSSGNGHWLLQPSGAIRELGAVQ
jgi:hypothetical protein